MNTHSKKKSGRDSRSVNWRHASGNGRKRNTKEKEILADNLHGRRKSTKWRGPKFLTQGCPQSLEGKKNQVAREHREWTPS
jgi:hypothetical protein